MTKEYTGGSVSYYRVKITNPTALPAPYEAECNDIIEALKMTFAEGNAFKAIWRKCAARSLGLSKQGYSDGLYDSEKVEFFGHRMVVQEQSARHADSEDYNERPRCPGCSCQVGAFHAAGCAMALATQIDDPLKPTNPWDSVEPAAQIDDESDRQKAVEQNGNDGAVYDDPWYGAPEWANYKAQDENGEWWWFEVEPYTTEYTWQNTTGSALRVVRRSDTPISKAPHWHNALISR